MKKVLLIENSKQVTGAFRSVLNTCQYLINDIEFFWAVPEGCWTQRKLPQDHIYPFNYLEIRRSITVLWYFPRLLQNVIKARKILRSHHIEVVHVADLYNMVGVGLKILHPKIRLIYHIRLRKSSYVSFFYRIWTKIIKRVADDIICVSDAVLNDLGSSKKSVIIYDSLGPEWQNLAQKSTRDHAEIQFLYVGNYIPGKGQNFAISAFHVAQKQAPNLRLKFVGSTMGKSGNEKFLRTLKEEQVQYSLEDSVRINYYSENISKEMEQCDVVLNFSESESFSMVCLEALASGKPIIATRCGGPEEIIRDKINGLLVPNRDIKAMTEAMILLATNKSMRSNFSQNSHVDFAEKFNARRLGELLKQYYYKPIR